MKKICIVGSFQDDLDRILKHLHAAGVYWDGELTAQMREWHRTAVGDKKIRIDGPTLDTDAVGETCVTQVQTILGACRDSKPWGWADTRSIWLLNWWRAVDTEIQFVLAFETQHDLLVRLVKTGIVQDNIQAAVVEWMNLTRELLRFHLRHPGRSILVRAHACLANPRALVHELAARWNCPLECGDYPALLEPPPDAVVRLIAASMASEFPECEIFAQELDVSEFPLMDAPSAQDLLADAILLYRTLCDREDKSISEFRRVERELLAAQAKRDLETQALTVCLQEKETLVHELLDERQGKGRLEKELLELTAKLAQVCDVTEKFELQSHQQVSDNIVLREALSLQNAEFETERLNWKDNSDKLIAELERERDRKHELEGLRSAMEQLTRSHECLARDELERSANLAAMNKLVIDLRSDYNTAVAAMKQEQLRCSELENRCCTVQAENEALLQGNALIQKQLSETQRELDNYFSECQALERQGQRYRQIDEQLIRVQAAYAASEELKNRLLLQLPDWFEYESCDAALRRTDVGAATLDLTFAGLRARAVTATHLRLSARIVGEFLKLGIVATTSENAIAPLPDFDWLRAQASATSALSATQWQALLSLHTVVATMLDNPTILKEVKQESQRSWSVAAMNSLNFLRGVPSVFRFDTIELEREQVNPDYEHLWLRLNSVCLGQRAWEQFEFRISCANVQPGRFGSHPKLEFPPSNNGPITSWFAESRDDFGPKLELRFALPDAIDLVIWERLCVPDQELIAALITRLPDILEGVFGQVRRNRRPKLEWLSMAASMQQITATRTMHDEDADEDREAIDNIDEPSSPTPTTTFMDSAMQNTSVCTYQTGQHGFTVSVI
jgi:hypothetical protein